MYIYYENWLFGPFGAKLMQQCKTTSNAHHELFSPAMTYAYFWIEQQYMIDVFFILVVIF